jgi:hypothetical protein
MTRRPDPFDKSKLEVALREVGCPESFISTAVSNYRLFVPLLFAKLGEERLFEIICAAQDELGLGDQHSAWRSSIKYLIEWAEHALEEYIARRGRTLPIVSPEQQKAQKENDLVAEQPRLL